VDQGARKVAELEGVSMRLYKIIYRLLEDVEKALKGLLEPEMVEMQIIAEFNAWDAASDEALENFEKGLGDL